MRHLVVAWNPGPAAPRSVEVPQPALLTLVAEGADVQLSWGPEDTLTVPAWEMGAGVAAGPAHVVLALPGGAAPPRGARAVLTIYHRG